MTEVLQVRIDEPGGGMAHVDLLIRRLGPSVQAEELVIPKKWTRSPARWTSVHKMIAEASRGKQVIHAHGVRAAFHTVSAAKSRQLPLVTTVHGLHAVRRGGWSQPLALRVTRWTLERCARILTLSADDHAMLIAAGIPDHKIRDIQPIFEIPPPYPSHLARSELKIEPDAFVLLWAGRFEEEKDPLTLVHAVQRLDESILVIMAGDGTLGPAIRQTAAPTGGHFLFPGWVDNLQTLYSAADVFVNSSRWEAAPMGALEAAGAGLPLLLSAVPGNRLLISMDMALAFPPGDVDSLARVIRYLKQYPQERSARAARSTAILHSTFLQDTPRFVETIYDEIAGA